MTGKTKAFLGGGVVGFILAGIVALISAQMIENTTEPAFCGSCHEMEPMYNAWEKGPHGPAGNKRGAVRAGCADCHLPHENVVTYLFNKAKFGTNDLLVHFFAGGHDGDVDYWLEKRKHREHFVFVSNCERCHERLPDNIMHQKIKSGELKMTCLACHWNVGHGSALDKEIKKAFGE